METPEFSAAFIRAALQKKRDAAASEAAAERAAAAAETAAMRDAFEHRELPPDALQRVMLVVKRSIANGERDALVFRFPSEFMNDSGRSITSGIGDWTQHLTGVARTGYDFFKAALEPRGFSLNARIVEYKDGMPGDVGFYLSWATPEA